MSALSGIGSEASFKTLASALQDLGGEAGGGGGSSAVELPCRESRPASDEEALPGSQQSIPQSPVEGQAAVRKRRRPVAGQP
eukprot:4095134-Alexandrium_andersonii.AAC.1